MKTNKREVFNYVKSVANKPFVWGVLDCTLFSAFALDKLLGQDRAQEHAGQWSNAEEAIAYSVANDLTLESWFTDNGCEEIPVNYQQTGDLMLINTLEFDGEPWVSAGVCLGVNTAVCTANGVEMFKTRELDFFKIVGVR